MGVCLQYGTGSLFFSGFVFPRESVTYPDCRPDLGEGGCGTSDAQVYLQAGLGWPLPCPLQGGGGAQMSVPGSACASFACAQRRQRVNNRRTDCIWNGGVAQEVDVVYFLIDHANVGQATDYCLLVWICCSLSLIAGD